MAKSPPKPETREERLAKALRANLRRRKAQDRARSSQDKPGDEGGKGSSGDGGGKGSDKEKA